MAEQKKGVQFSPRRNKHKKHRIKSWFAAAAAVLLVVAALVIAGIQYSKFVTQTIYEESTAHLVEVLHQSNKMLNETVNKNMTYLHIWPALYSIFPMSEKSVSLSRPLGRKPDSPSFTSSRRREII